MFEKKITTMDEALSIKQRLVKKILYDKFSSAPIFLRKTPYQVLDGHFSIQDKDDIHTYFFNSTVRNKDLDFYPNDRIEDTYLNALFSKYNEGFDVVYIYFFRTRHPRIYNCRIYNMSWHLRHWFNEKGEIPYKVIYTMPTRTINGTGDTASKKVVDMEFTEGIDLQFMNIELPKQTRKKKVKPVWKDIK